MGEDGTPGLPGITGVRVSATRRAPGANDIHVYFRQLAGEAFRQQAPQGLLL